jgi:hypothetical protein
VRAGDADETQEFAAGAGIAAEAAGHAAGHHRDIALVHAAGGHALVHRVHHHSRPARLEHLGDAVGDLRGELFLHLKAPRITVDHPCQLADADDLIGRQVADVHAPDDRRHVMLAMRFEGNVAQHYHLVVAADLFERAPQVGGRVDLVTGEPVAIGIHHALRGIEQPLAIRILPRPAQQRAHRVFRGTPRHLRFCARHCVSPRPRRAARCRLVARSVTCGARRRA